MSSTYANYKEGEGFWNYNYHWGYQYKDNPDCQYDYRPPESYPVKAEKPLTDFYYQTPYRNQQKWPNPQIAAVNHVKGEDFKGHYGRLPAGNVGNAREDNNNTRSGHQPEKVSQPPAFTPEPAMPIEDLYPWMKSNKKGKQQNTSST